MPSSTEDHYVITDDEKYWQMSLQVRNEAESMCDNTQLIDFKTENGHWAKHIIDFHRNLKNKDETSGFNRHESRIDYYNRRGLITPNQALGIRFKVRLVMGELLSTDAAMLSFARQDKKSNRYRHDKVITGTDVIKQLQEINQKSDKHQKKFVNLSNTSRLSTSNTSITNKTDASTQTLSSSGCHYTRFLSVRNYIQTIVAYLSKNRLSTYSSDELAHQLFYLPYEGEDAYQRYRNHVRQIFRGKFNYTLLRQAYPMLFSVENRDTKIVDGVQVTNGFILDPNRQKLVDKIWCFLEPNENIQCPMMIVKAKGMDKAQAACIAYLLDHNHGKDSPLRRFDSVLYVPCDSSGSGQQVTYQKMLSYLHAHFYPENHPELEDRQFSDPQNPIVKSLESRVDLSTAELKEDNETLRSQLKAVRNKFLQESILVIFGGLLGEDSYDKETRSTRAAIDNNPSLALIRNLSEPSVSDHTYCKYKNRQLSHYFNSRILVFSAAQSTALEPYTNKQNVLNIMPPKVMFSSLLKTESNIQNVEDINYLRRHEMENYFDQSSLYLLDTNLSLCKEITAKQGKHIDLTSIEIDSNEQLSTQLLESTLKINPLYPIMLGILVLTSGAIRPLTLLRLTDRVVRALHLYKQNGQEEHSFADHFKDLEVFSTQYGSPAENINKHSLINSFINRFSQKLIRMIKEDKNHRIEESIHASAYVNDVLERLSPWQEQLYGSLANVKSLTASHEVLEFVDITIKRNLVASLKHVLGQDVVGLLHYAICDEAARQHQIMLRNRYWLDESYRQYRHLYQAIMHGFLFFKFECDEPLMTCFDSKMPKNRAKYFLYVYIFLYRDLGDDKERHKMLRVLETPKTRIELLKLGKQALDSFRDKHGDLVATQSINKASLMSKLTNQINLNTWHDLEHDLLVSLANSLRREGQFAESAAVVKNARIKAKQRLNEAQRTSPNIRSAMQERDKEYIKHYDLVLVDALIINGGENTQEQNNDAEKIVKSIFHDSFGSHIWDGIKEQIEKIKEQLKKSNPIGGLTTHNTDFNQLVVTSLNALRYTIEGENKSLDELYPNELSDLSNLLSRMSELLYYQSMDDNNIQNPAEREKVLKAYVYYCMSDILRRMTFPQEPFQRYHYINAHLTRMHIRMLFKFQKVTAAQQQSLTNTFPAWPGLRSDDKAIVNQIRYLLDSLSLTIGNYPRERSALLILESQHCRKVHRDIRQAFRYICQAARYLTVLSENPLVMARLRSERIKLCCDILITRENHCSDALNFSEQDLSNQEVIKLIDFDLIRLKQMTKQLKVNYWYSALARREELVNSTKQFIA